MSHMIDIKWFPKWVELFFMPDQADDHGRFSPETLHLDTMRDHVMQRMLESHQTVAEERAVRGMRQEARREQELTEAAVAEHHASTQQLAALLMELGANGAELMVEMPDRQLAGRVVHVGDEMVSIESIGGDRYDLASYAIAGVRLTRGQPRPGSVSTGHPNTVVARLREAVAQGEAVSVSRRFGAPMSGLLQACSDSHVQGVDHNNSVWIVPLGMVTWIASI